MGDKSSKEKGLGGVVYENFGPDNSSGKVKKVLEFMIYFVGFLGTILTIPQAYRIWTTQDAAGDAIISWLALTLFTPFWIFYGILHKKRSLIMTYLVWFVINALVVIGIWIFG